MDRVGLPHQGAMGPVRSAAIFRRSEVSVSSALRSARLRMSGRVTVPHACPARLVAQRLRWPAVPDVARGRAQRQLEAGAARQDALSSRGLLRGEPLEAGFQAKCGDRIADRPPHLEGQCASSRDLDLAPGRRGLPRSCLVRFRLRAGRRVHCVEALHYASRAVPRQIGAGRRVSPEVLGGPGGAPGPPSRRLRRSRPGCVPSAFPGAAGSSARRPPRALRPLLREGCPAPCRGCWVEGRFGG
jgi:hypothetical protein